MDFVLLLVINMAVLALMYLLLRHQILKNYGNKSFLDNLQREVNGIITDLNQTTESNVQILNNESAKLKKLKENTEKRIEELGQLYRMVTEADDRYTSILENSRKRKRQPTAVAEQPQQPQQPEPQKQPGSVTPAPKSPMPKSPMPKSPEEKSAASEGQSHAEPDPRKRVVGLYDQGRSLHEIAERTQLSIDAIELIIEMAK